MFHLISLFKLMFHNVRRSQLTFISTECSEKDEVEDSFSCGTFKLDILLYHPC